VQTQFVRGFFRDHNGEIHLTVVIDTTCDCGPKSLRSNVVNGQAFELAVDDPFFWNSADVAEQILREAEKTLEGADRKSLIYAVQAVMRRIPFTVFRICLGSTDNMRDVDVEDVPSVVEG
jgi:hypothetical protein